MAVLSVLVFGNGLTAESDILLHGLDEYAIFALTIGVVMILAASWKRQSADALRRQHNLITRLFVVALAFQLFAFAEEINDPADFGNEVSSLILIVLALVNRFV